MVGLFFGRGVFIIEGLKEGFGGLVVVKELYGLFLIDKKGVVIGFR